MTSRIHPLPTAIASRIAAGEVIERPASVVKELLDNALDAGSTRILIEIHNGGRQCIQVTDNGTGIHPEDALLALQRFTTSKMRHLDDLTHLATLGFRGEALASIAAVAEIELITRQASALAGVRVHQPLGGRPSSAPIGCPVGTRVRVQHLFAQVPVRLHAMKSIAREVQFIHEVVAHYALAHPHVTFHLQHDGRRVLFVSPGEDMRARVAAALGQEMAASMLTVQSHAFDIHIAGMISAPELHRATRQRHYVWVNGRPIRSALVSAAVTRGYGPCLPAGRHPVIALGFTLPPALLDINIHPRKTEIKFLQERAIFAAVQDTVEQTIQRSRGSILPWEEDRDNPWNAAELWTAQVGEASSPYPVAGKPSLITPLQPLGHINHTFLVASNSAGLVLLDQHAAHESLLYVQLTTAPGPLHDLNEPWVFALMPEEYALLQTLQPALQTMHIHCEPFGRETLLLHTVPGCLQTQLRPTSFREALLEVKSRLRPHAPPEEQRDQFAAALACRCAVRAGDILQEEQRQHLITALTGQHLAYTCPHGRPTHVMMTLAELERRFLRL